MTTTIPASTSATVPMPPKRATRLPVKGLEKTVPGKIKPTASPKSRSFSPVPRASSGASRLKLQNPSAAAI